MNNIMNNQIKQQFSSIGWFLCQISGANMRILSECPNDHKKAMTIGLFVLVNTVMAIISGTFFFTESFNLPVYLAIFGGFLWGGIFFCLEFIILTFFRKGKGAFYRTLPRIILAVLISIAFNEAIMLKLFSGEINAKMDDQKQVKLDETRSNSKLQTKKQKLEGEIETLENSLNSLKQNVDNAEAVKEKERGGIKSEATTGKDGEGSIYAIKEAIYNSAKKKYDDEKPELEEKISGKKTELKKIEDEINKEVADKEEIENGNSGFWKKNAVLFEMMAESPKMIAVYLILSLIFLSIETYPITQKLLAKPSKYDKLMEEQDEIDDEEVKIYTERKKNELNRDHNANETLADKIWDGIPNINDSKETDLQKAIYEDYLYRQKIGVFGEDKQEQTDNTFGKPIHIEVDGKAAFKGTTLKMSAKFENTATLINFTDQLEEIEKDLTQEEGEEMKLKTATNSMGEEIDWHFQPLVNQLNKDRTLRLYFESDDIFADTILN